MDTRPGGSAIPEQLLLRYDTPAVAVHDVPAGTIRAGRAFAPRPARSYLDAGDPSWVAGVPRGVAPEAIRDNRAMTDHTGGSFRGDRFTGTDFTGAILRDCDLRGVKVADSWLVDVAVSGLVERFVVNDVDVTAYVEAELDRRHPERVQARHLRTADDLRAMWDTVEGLWSAAVARARRLPEAARHERVHGEWSFVETLRHLVFATDAWAARTVLDEAMPYHRLGLPQDSYPPEDAAALGIDLAARPSFDDVVDVRAGRQAMVRRIVEGLTDADLERRCTRPPAPGYPDQPRTVGSCLGVVMREEVEHHRYAVRDLAVLETGA